MTVGEEKRTVRLMVVDDHELARAGLVSILESENGFEVVGTASGGRAAMNLARRLQDRKSTRLNSSH